MLGNCALIVVCLLLLRLYIFLNFFQTIGLCGIVFMGVGFFVFSFDVVVFFWFDCCIVLPKLALKIVLLEICSDLSM